MNNKAEKDRELEHTLFDFFSKLSDRMYKENDVSDILYAGLKTSHNLREIFEKLGISISEELDLAREVKIDLGRPDFLIKTKTDEALLLEIKLFDTNYHYEEYSSFMYEDGQKIVLITAHKPVRPLPGWEIVYWEEVIKLMDMVDDAFISSLNRYLKEVTMYKELKPITLSRPLGILYFNRAFEYVIKGYQSEKVDSGIYKRTLNFSENYNGYYYYLKSLSEPGNEAWLYFGLVYYDDYDNEICEGIQLWVQKKWTKSYDCILNALESHYNSIIEDEEGCYIMLGNDKFDEILSTNNVEQQLDIMKAFFNEFNNTVEECL